MKEISRIIIEEYCRSHNTKKSKQLSRLVEMSYDFCYDGTEEDDIILYDLIDQE